MRQIAFIRLCTQLSSNKAGIFLLLVRRAPNHRMAAASAAAGGCAVAGCCAAEAAAREFIATLGVADAYLSPKWDKCYCERCYLPRYPDTFTNDGPTPYVVPRGWYRFGLTFGGDTKAKAQDIFNKWSASYHGVKSKAVLESILECGQLMKPGDKLLDGTKLRSTKCAGRQDEGFYTSLTVKYAGLKFYADRSSLSRWRTASRWPARSCCSAGRSQRDERRTL